MITARVATAAAAICEILAAPVDGPLGEYIAETIQECCEAELEEAAQEASGGQPESSTPGPKDACPACEGTGAGLPPGLFAEKCEECNGLGLIMRATQ